MPLKYPHNCICFRNQVNSYDYGQKVKGPHSSTLATLPRFENTHNYDSYYYQQYNDGNAHPFSRVLLEFLSILKCRCPSLDMIDCIVDLNKPLINANQTKCALHSTYTCIQTENQGCVSESEQTWLSMLSKISPWASTKTAMSR